MVPSQEFNAATAAEQPFPLALDGSAPEELLKAGKYDWVSDYAKQIVQSKFYAVAEGGDRNCTSRSFILEDTVAQRYAI